MQNVQIFIREYRNGSERIRQAEESKEVRRILLWIFFGILTGLSWAPLWNWLLTGYLLIEKPETIIPALLISAAGAVILLPIAWKRLQEAPDVIRWAVAYSYGWGSISFLREGPIEAGLTVFNVQSSIYAFPTETTFTQRALLMVAVILGIWLARRIRANLAD